MRESGHGAAAHLQKPGRAIPRCGDGVAPNQERESFSLTRYSGTERSGGAVAKGVHGKRRSQSNGAGYRMSPVPPRATSQAGLVSCRIVCLAVRKRDLDVGRTPLQRLDGARRRSLEGLGKMEGDQTERSTGALALASWTFRFQKASPGLMCCVPSRRSIAANRMRSRDHGNTTCWRTGNAIHRKPCSAWQRCVSQAGRWCPRISPEAWSTGILATPSSRVFGSTDRPQGGG